MSAITGIFFRDDSKISAKIIKNMNDMLSHRGPDGCGVWVTDSVGLGHQMLWTTPESLNEKLPFYEEDLGLVITADARIDNRKELSTELNIPNDNNATDSFFILKAYEKWGEKCPEYLLGDFAFAIWDENEERMFCARDHMGVKPFYYYLDDNIFVFGTEIKSLLKLSNVPKLLNKKKLALFLMNDLLDKETTFYEHIKGLIAAHSITINKFECQINRYWQLDPEKEIIMDSEEEYIQAFIEIFNESVNCRLRSYSEVGFSLSGGIDSSSIVCTAKKIFSKNKNFKPVNTFSFVFDEIPESDERDYIKKIINTKKINSVLVNCDKVSPINEINKILCNQDQPFYSPNMSMHYKFFKKVRESGIRIILSGDGGDEIVSYGQNYIRELAVSLKWKKLMLEIEGRSNNLKMNKYKIIFDKIIFPSIPNYLKKRIRLYLNRHTNKILNQDFLYSILERYDENFVNEIHKIETFNSKEFHYYVINNISHHSTVFEPVDRVCGANSIESRYPFFDKRLIEFCYAIPTELKLKFGWDRYILRLAMTNILPKEIQWRPDKTDLSPVYKKNLLLNDKRLEKIISKENINIMEFIDFDELNNDFEKYKSGDNSVNLFNIWLLILSSLWLESTEFHQKEGV
jgi:asparagine synthase (glutamine-hydrolysing)